MRILYPVVLLLSAVPAIAGPDLGTNVGICQTIQKLPRDAVVILGCDDNNLKNYCQFRTKLNKQHIIVTVENGVIIEKSINFLSNNISAFGIRKNDNPKIVRQKLKKFGVSKMILDDEDYKLYPKSGLSLRSN